MTGPRRPFDPAELRGVDGEPPSDAELAGLLATARELEALARDDEPGMTTGFTDRVMSAIATEPPPRGVAAVAGAAGVLATLRNAWRTATTGGRPLAVRAQAMALLLIVAVGVASLGTVAAVGVAGLLRQDGTPPPTVGPAPTEPRVGPTDALEPSLTPSPPVPSPSPSISPSPSPTATDEVGQTPEPTETSEPSETEEAGDDGGNSGSGGGDSGSGSGKTHEPDETDEPDEPDDTPEPDETDEPEDH